jgi:hypothetical protein
MIGPDDARPEELDGISVTDAAMHLQLELLAFEEALARSTRLIPQSLAEFLHAPWR